VAAAGTSYWYARKAGAVALVFALLGLALHAAEVVRPRVWIFAGLTGDAERAERYLTTVTRLRDALQQQFGLAQSDIRILFDRGVRPFPACDEAALLRELDAMVAASASGRPLWLLFVGHGASGKDEVRFHLPGPDVTARQVGEGLARAGSGAPVVILLTQAASGAFLGPLAGPNRVLVAAAASGMEDNETEFPHVLADVWTRPREADADGDGVVSVAEMVAAVSTRVDAWYRERGLVNTERAVIDGNGDGRVDPAPDSEDLRTARGVGLAYQR
jgi:hypothetical protein